MAHRSATPSALKSWSTDLQAPSEQEETPSIYKKPADVQDSKMQPVHNLDDGKSDDPPSTRTRDTDTLTSAEERRGKSPPKGRMTDGDRGATEPRKSPSANEQLPAPPVPTQSPTTSASASSNGLSQDDDLAQLSTIDQWRRTSTPLSPIQEVAPGAPSIDRLGKTAGIDRTAPPSTPDQTLYEQSDKSSKDERTPKMTRRQAPLSDTRQTSASIQETILGARGPSDDMFGETSNTDQMTTKMTSKQTPAQGVAPDAGDSGDEKPVVGKKAAPTLTSQGPVSGSRQTEPVTGVSPTSRGSTEDESDDSAISPAPLQPPASDGRSASTAIQEGIHDGHRKNEAVKPPISGPSGRPTTTRGLEATPGTQSHTVSDEVPEQAPPLPSFVDRRNEKPGMAEPGQQSKAHAITGDESADIPTPNETTIPPAPLQAPASDGRSASAALQGGMLDARGENEAIKPPIDDPRDQASDKAPMLPSFTDTRSEKTDVEAGQTTIAPHEQPGRRVAKDVGAPAGGSLPMKSQENMNQTYGDGTYTQKLSGDQSRAQPAENKKQGGDETVVTEFGKSKEVDFFADAKQNNTGKDQAISTYGPSTKKMYTDQNESISSEDVVKQTTETVFYRSSAISREIQPPVPEKSMTEQQLQGDKSSISPQDNGKQDFENVPPVSGAEQHNQRELLTIIDRNSGKTPGKTSQKSEEQTPPDTQQVKNNRGNSTLDSSSKPQLDGNQGDFPGSQTGSSSNNA